MSTYRSLALVATLALQTIGLAGRVAPSRDAGPIVIRALSTRPDRVSGGDVRVSVELPLQAGGMQVMLNGRDVTSAFHQFPDRHGPGASGPWLGLVTGLAVGRNTISISGRKRGVADATLQLTNYPITGPIISGPPQQPYVCQTDTFTLPDGSKLGAATDANCSAPTRVQYVYLPRGGKDFKPLPNTKALPPDVGDTTVNLTASGPIVTVPFVVRVETGTMNRGIYQTLVLHDPTKDAAPSPFTPPPAWNGRLIALHGVGCPSGWYRQGGVMGVNPLAGANLTRLGEGYAIFTNTLNHPTNSCNPFLAGETTMMGKEHVIETFGMPAFTVSVGSSGGAYTSLQIADEFPGLFDGILINATFPDALSIALAGGDAHLLTHYFTSTQPAGFTDAQKVAVSGYSGMKALTDAANQSQRTDPIAGRLDIEGYNSAVWNDAIPKELRYDPKANPHGARPTVFDAARNIYGVDQKTGFALRPFDNVGVQYGLAALAAGTITPTQFLDLNEKIGGYDEDANYVAARSTGDAAAIKRAYQGGITLGGGGGLGSIPVFDDGAYNDAGGYHYQWFHFAIRERMATQNGNAGNHVMWRGPVQTEPAWRTFTNWVAAVKADGSDAPQRDKVIRSKPPEAIDGCWVAEAGPAFIAEPQTFSSKPDSRCNTVYPSASFTRRAAGGPLDANVLKCQLKAIDAKDYGAAFTTADLQRLQAIFPAGACDWSKSGVSQTRVVPWASFGPAPENLLFDVGHQKTSN
jgi:Tannase-like family of unknown function (DUF6351)